MTIFLLISTHEPPSKPYYVNGSLPAFGVAAQVVEDLKCFVQGLGVRVRWFRGDLEGLGCFGCAGEGGLGSPK